jgi:hypothetical protein
VEISRTFLLVFVKSLHTRSYCSLVLD